MPRHSAQLHGLGDLQMQDFVASGRLPSRKGEEARRSDEPAVVMAKRPERHAADENVVHLRRPQWREHKQNIPVPWSLVECVPVDRQQLKGGGGRVRRPSNQSRAGHGL